MTEQPGRRARWTALLLLAPSSAGLFGGAVWWAGHTGPSAASPAAPSAPLVRQPAAAPPTAAADAAADAAASAAASVVRAQQAAVHRRAIQRLHRAQAVNAALERRVARLQHS
ncbi:MAG: hypothetical protein ACTHMS_22600, partial [Jatrophihabitans sp.]